MGTGGGGGLPGVTGPVCVPWDDGEGGTVPEH